MKAKDPEIPAIARRARFSMNRNISQLVSYLVMLLEILKDGPIQQGRYLEQLTPLNTFESRSEKTNDLTCLKFFALFRQTASLPRLALSGAYHFVMSANNQMPCDFCQRPYDPIATRWLCPHCHMKTNCCDGAPCPIPEQSEITIISNRRNELAGS